jgi:hypothetical protein
MLVEGSNRDFFCGYSKPGIWCPGLAWKHKTHCLCRAPIGFGMAQEPKDRCSIGEVWKGVCDVKIAQGGLALTTNTLVGHHRTRSARSAPFFDSPPDSGAGPTRALRWERPVRLEA